MISVICPVYNAEKYLKECIESVLSQTFSDWELLLIDDGSTDNSLNICSLYSKKEQRIKTFHKENEGQWLTREFGIKKANGDYFIFLDSDDMLKSNALKLLHDLIKKDGPEVILYDICKLEKDLSEVCLQELYDSHSFSQTKHIIDFCFVKNNCISLCVYCFKKSFYNSLTHNSGLDKSIRSQEDFLMLFDILQQTKSLVVLPHILYIYRTNENSTSQNLTISDYYKNIFVTDYIYINIFNKYNDNLKTYSQKIVNRLAWQPLSYLKRAYVELPKKETREQFKKVRRSFIFNNFTKKYKFASKKDRLIIWLFRLRMNCVNSFILKHF